MVYRFGYWGDRKSGRSNKKGRPGRKGPPPGGGSVGGNGNITWNSADKGTWMVLSNGDLTTTVTSGHAAWYAVRGTSSAASGKWYYEITPILDDGGSGTYIPGVAKVGASMNTFCGGDANGWGWQATKTAPLKWTNLTSGSYGTTIDPAGGIVIGVALDIDAGTLTFYRDGVSQGVAYSSLSGTFYPCVGVLGAIGNPNANAVFKASDWTHSPPANHLAWGST